MSTEQDKWRKFLQPVITGLCALMAAGVFALQQSDSNTMDARISVVESKVNGIEDLRKDVIDLTKTVHELIGEIRAHRQFKN